MDSPFTNLRVLAKELVESGQYVGVSFLSGVLVDSAMFFIRGSVKDKADFEIDDLVPLEYVSSTFVPAYFL